MIEITQEEYFKLRDGLDVLESFSDPDGVLSFGEGKPLMITVYGKKDKKILEIRLEKESCNDKDWGITYSKF